jgi:hypothetical protein
LPDVRDVTPLLGHSLGKTPFGVLAVAAAAQRSDEGRMAWALREVYEWTKHEPTTLDNDDCTHLFKVACFGLGIPFEGDLGDSVDGGEQT